MRLGDAMKSLCLFSTLKNCKNFSVEAHKITIFKISQNVSTGSYYYVLIRVDRFFCEKSETYERWTVVAVIFSQGFSIISHFSIVCSLKRNPFFCLRQGRNYPFAKTQKTSCKYLFVVVHPIRLMHCIGVNYTSMGTKFPKETEYRTKFSVLQRNQDLKNWMKNDRIPFELHDA